MDNEDTKLTILETPLDEVLDLLSELEQDGIIEFIGEFPIN